MIRALGLLAVLALAACSAPQAGVYRARDGTIATSVASNVGPLTVGISNSGAGHLGANLGWLSIGAGF